MGLNKRGPGNLRAFLAGVCVLGVGAGLGVCATPLWAEQEGREAANTTETDSGSAAPWSRPTLSFYGTPGLIDMPTAEVMSPSDVALSMGYFGDSLRNTLTFQITPRLSGSMRYSVLDDFHGAGKSRYDRSFDLSYLLAEEGTYSPALSIGLRDFGGTGIYAGEYLAATKTLGRLRATGGIGWGRLGSYNGFENPLAHLSSRFKDRPGGGTGIGVTGQVDMQDWFKGPAALFGGLQYQLTDRLVLSAEYSSDAYEVEGEHTGFRHESPFNFSATYQMRNGIDVTGAYLYGHYYGVMLTYRFNPASPPGPTGGREGQGPEVRPRSSAAELGWTALPQHPQGPRGAAKGSVTDAARKVLAAQGIELVSLSGADGGDTVVVHMRNLRYQAEAQALGRAARALTGVLPPQVETIVLVPMNGAVAMSAVTIKRSDLEELQDKLDGSWTSFVRSKITDARAYPLRAGTPGVFPQFSYGLGVYTGPTFANPDNLVAETGLSFSADYQPLPGVRLSTRLLQPMIIAGSGVPPINSGSSATPVRSDAGLYEHNHEFKINQLMAEYYFRPGQDFYGRLSMGYFEEMYGGLSSEVLWKPMSGPLALGLEMNVAVKRSPNHMLGLDNNYRTTTGYLSAYYDFGNGFLGEIDAGRYLARDWGTTISVNREFANGFRLGAYVTLTDVSSENFDEGSFDKGITFSIPLTWLFGEPSRRDYSATWRPINGDGGARMQIPTQLYDLVRSGQVPELRESWGRFWR